MKIVEINSVPYGSTGIIARNITNISKKYGDSYFFYSWTKKRKNNTLKDEFLIGSMTEKFISLQLEKITGNIGCFSFIGTKKLIKNLENIKPDIVHLHNLHEGYINYKILFSYLKKNEIKVVWTLHDCWSFTGHCPYFQISNCEKWKTGCFKCKKHNEYPKSLFDNSKKMYKYKKQYFTSLKKNNLIIVTPSNWLAKQVKESYLNKYNVVIINNGINLNIFKPTASNLKSIYDLKNKFIILGVAMDWGKRKGLDVFIQLARDLDDSYKIILVGTNKKIDKILPKNIISIHKTNNQSELAKIYTLADLFINPTREDNFPTVNIESLACGTPVITFNTGGSPEIIDSCCGIVIKENNYKILKDTIIELKKANKFKQTDCLIRATNYDYNKKFNEYIELFKKLERRDINEYF